MSEKEKQNASHKVCTHVYKREITSLGSTVTLKLFTDVFTNFIELTKKDFDELDLFEKVPELKKDKEDLEKAFEEQETLVFKFPIYNIKYDFLTAEITTDTTLDLNEVSIIVEPTVFKYVIDGITIVQLPTKANPHFNYGNYILQIEPLCSLELFDSVYEPKIIRHGFELVETKYVFTPSELEKYKKISPTELSEKLNSADDPSILGFIKRMMEGG